jgi:hypothetical protein
LAMTWVSWLSDHRRTPAFPPLGQWLLGSWLSDHSGATAPDLHRLPRVVA